MAPHTRSAQLSDSNAGPVLCEKCKHPASEPDPDADSASFPTRMQQMMKEWRLSPRMWPIGYLVGSSYSPLHIEHNLPGPDWRNAFEDLLALESGGEMINPEIRKAEQVAAARIGWERASYVIDKVNKLNERDSHNFAEAQRGQGVAKQKSNWKLLSLLGVKFGKDQEVVKARIEFAQLIKTREGSRKGWSASRYKDRGQWMASLISSGALTSWASDVRDSADGVYIVMGKLDGGPENFDGISFTESELAKHFLDGQPLGTGNPGPPTYYVHQTGNNSQSPQGRPVVMSHVPDHPYLISQYTYAARVKLPDGEHGTRVLLRNTLTNGEVEDKVFVQEPSKVLEEVEKARALMHDRFMGFEAPV